MLYIGFLSKNLAFKEASYIFICFRPGNDITSYTQCIGMALDSAYLKHSKPNVVGS